MKKKILIAAGAIVISSAIGLTVAMRASGATATVSKPTYATNEVLDTSSVSSEVSSAVSSAVSSTVSSAVSSAVSSEVSSSPSSVGAVDNIAVDNTDARNAALQTENDRHTQALTDINNRYDPQISAAQTEGQDVLDQNAVDCQANLRKLLEQAANGGLLNSGWYQTQQDQLVAAQQSADQKVLDKRTADVANLTAQKQSAIDSENSFHASQAKSINAIYP